MSEKQGNDIHDAYMNGLFNGEKRIIDLVGGLLADALEEIRKQEEAQE